MLKLRWMQEAMTQFDRHRNTGVDVYFFVGVALSAVVIAVILFPVGLIGLLVGSRSRPRVESTPPPLPRIDD
jgi:hypothetical protein